MRCFVRFGQLFTHLWGFWSKSISFFEQIKGCIVFILSKPKLNQQLSSTEFEVRLHSYPEVHHPPPTTTQSRPLTSCLRQPGARLTSAGRPRACAVRVGLDACPSQWGQFEGRAVVGNRSSSRLSS